MEKNITSIKIQNVDTFISPRGETRQIKLRGTAGSGFSLEINDSDGDCILEEELQNIEIPRSGVYILNQKFPSISTSVTGGLTEAYYEIKINAHADVSCDLDKITLYQYPDVTLTLSNSGTSARMVVSGDDVAVTRPAKHEGLITKPQTLVITEVGSDGGGVAGFFYVNGNVNSSISKNTVITRRVKADADPKRSKYAILKPLTTRVVGDAITGEISAGMSVGGKITKSKIIHKSLDVSNCRKATNKFELDDTVGLLPSMFGSINGINDFQIVSIDCDKNITIDRKVVIPENSNVSFTYKVSSNVVRVHTQVNEDGNACVDLSTKMMLIDGMDLELDDDRSRVISSFGFSGSGTNAVTLTLKANFSRFGTRDVTHTIDLDNIITRKPNARSFSVDIPKNSTSFQIGTSDFDYDSSTKTATVTGDSKNGSTAVSGRVIAYTPVNGFVGVDKILYTLSDGTTASDEKTINITVK
mgnify:CR=1 FL=1|tara:strand:- start:734 stop:2149 length:1416 start_codon:yes stop_codon:yes gene_type:complete